MMQAFLFDLDGVIIDDESTWEKAKEKMYVELFGKEIVAKMGSTIGLNINAIYELASKYGSTTPKERVVNAFYHYGDEIYQTAPITDGLEELVQIIKQNDFLIGIVSASPKRWIDIVIDRLSFKNDISLVFSIYDRSDLRHKPEPDGYLEAMKQIGSTSETTIALEDSNAGIASAKAAGIYTIGLKQNLVAGYEQNGADIYAENISDVINIVKNFRSY